MTKAVIPYLVKHGVVAVSVGVNGRSAPPAVPVLFKWYYKGDYVLATWHPGKLTSFQFVINFLF